MLLKYQPEVEHLKSVCVLPVEGKELKLPRSQIILMPGTNEVTNDEWQAMKVQLASEIKRGEIVTLAQQVTGGRGKGGKVAIDLKDMPSNVAIKYVTECTNPETLIKWYHEETREEVRVRIMKAMEKMKVDLPEFVPPETPNMATESLDLDDDFLDGEDEENSKKATGKKSGKKDDNIDLDLGDDFDEE